jgi:murein DD-endopeptidase MepM/ murein hydrolase activator NlpD
MLPNQLKLTNPVLNGTIRKNDKWGKGHYGAPRGNRNHNGVDIVTQLGKDVLSPIEGKVIRVSYPYANDLSYTGLLLEGSGSHKGYEIKIFYMKPLPNIVGKPVKPGQKIGSAQSLLSKYPGITNHIHIEIKHNGVQKDPKTLINNLF